MNLADLSLVVRCDCWKGKQSSWMRNESSGGKTVFG